MSDLVKIPEDLKAIYKLNKQVLRCFRTDEDAVKQAERTIALIERIAQQDARQQETNKLLNSWNMADGLIGLKQLMDHAENLRQQYNRSCREKAQQDALLRDLPQSPARGTGREQERRHE